MGEQFVVLRGATEAYGPFDGYQAAALWLGDRAGRILKLEYPSCITYAKLDENAP